MRFGVNGRTIGNTRARSDDDCANRVFNQYEIAGYVASRKPAARKTLEQLLLTH